MGAFFGCKGLTSLDLSACTSLTTIGECAFYGCTGLTEVKLPASLTTIDRSAFYGCTGLTEIKLPANLIQIGGYAFSDCTGLTSAVFEDTNGWAVYSNESYSGTSTSISSSDLAAPATAAWYLRQVYDSKYWKKN